MPHSFFECGKENLKLIAGICLSDSIYSAVKGPCQKHIRLWSVFPPLIVILNIHYSKPNR